MGLKFPFSPKNEPKPVSSASQPRIPVPKGEWAEKTSSAWREHSGFIEKSQLIQLSPPPRMDPRVVPRPRSGVGGSSGGLLKNPAVAVVLIGGVGFGLYSNGALEPVLKMAGLSGAETPDVAEAGGVHLKPIAKRAAAAEPANAAAPVAAAADAAGVAAAAPNGPASGAATSAPKSPDVTAMSASPAPTVAAQTESAPAATAANAPAANAPAGNAPAAPAPSAQASAPQAATPAATPQPPRQPANFVYRQANDITAPATAAAEAAAAAISEQERKTAE